MRRFLPIILVVAALAAGCYVGYVRGVGRPAVKTDGLVVSFLDADLGNAVVIETPEKGFTVIDPGPARTAEALGEYLEGMNARSLSIVIANPSGDHRGALETLMESFAIKRILHGEAVDSESWTQALADGKPIRVPEIVLTAGDTIKLSPTVKMEVLSPPKGLLKGKHSSDDDSLVTRVRFGRTSVLLTSDIRRDAEGYLIRSVRDLASNVLVVSRHGRAGSASLELLARTRPQQCVVLCGRGANRPSRSVLRRIGAENTGAEVYRTDRDGPLNIVSDGRAITVYTQVARP